MDLRAGHPRETEQDSGASWDRVSTNYLQNFGMKMVRGRGFTAADNETTANVAIVNEAFVNVSSSRTKIQSTSISGWISRAGQHLSDHRRGARREIRRFPARWAGAPNILCPAGPEGRLQGAANAAHRAPSHFIRGVMLVTDLPPGILKPMLRRKLVKWTRT